MNKSILFKMMAIAMMGSSPNHQPSGELTNEEKEALKRLRQEKDIQNKAKRGLKPFDYDGVIIWALNEKNADRKAKRKGLLNN